jgi:cell division protein FtsB
MRRRGTIRDSVVLLLGAVVTAYFSYHAVAGRTGFEARSRVVSERAGAETRLRDLEAVRAGLERDIGLLQADNLDADMLDEQARQALGMARPDEVVVLLP